MASKFNFLLSNKQQFPFFSKASMPSTGERPRLSGAASGRLPATIFHRQPAKQLTAQPPPGNCFGCERNFKHRHTASPGPPKHRFPRVSLEFYIDVHAHSTMLNGFMYGNVFEDEERVQRQAVFPRLLCQNAPDFSFSNTSFNRDMVKAGTGRRFLGGLLDDTSYCYTLEVSFYSYMAAGSTAPVPYTEETCILQHMVYMHLHDRAPGTWR
ncbi:Cytosolic carboxypeptidase 6 [Liparis tanakae]|uniref:Cytosolic carboxypeptidase 6 n=1 Tax=Liparis tanakae TaxID=230148 RepID=A0A4Z2IBG6_9TELE|nr:Cytosolic carboxypeptidase 6 [Liparis tanakae]